MEAGLAQLIEVPATALRGLDPDAAIVQLQHVEGLLARLHAIQAELLVAAAAPESRVDEFAVLDPRPDRHEERLVRICDAVREEIASALRWSPATAAGRIDAARLLCGPLSQTRACLLAGLISPGHATAVVEAAGRLPGRPGSSHEDPDIFARGCDELQRRVLPVAERGTISQTRSAGRRAVLAIDAAGVQRRRREELCTRDVHVMDEPDGMSTIFARMTTEQAHTIMRAVVAHAEVANDPFLRAGERRVEALTALVVAGCGSATGSGVGSSQAVTVQLDVIVGWGDLLSDEPRSAVVDGVDVPMEAVRDLLAAPEVDVMVRRLVADPVTGVLSGVGRRSYRIPERLREFIALRDGACRFPGCRRRAARCQIDHADAWDDGGSSDPQNLGPLCTRHHQLKTHGGWQLLESGDDGSCTWRSPARRVYRREPVPVLAPPEPQPPPF
jgi:hypothetical protein